MDRSGTVDPDSGRGGEHPPALLPVLARLPGHLLWRAHARVIAATTDLASTGVDVHAHGALVALADGRARSQQDLAELVDLSRTTVARIAAGLEDSGLVERVRNPSDRRSYALTRTAAGAKAVDRWRPAVEDLETGLASGLGGAASPRSGALRRLLAAMLLPELAVAPPDELVGSTGYLVSRLHQHLHRDFSAALEPVGIEPRHYGALVALDDTGPTTQSVLGHNLGVSGPSVVQVVDDLEARGLAERRRSPLDRRVQVVHLRARSRSVLARSAVLAATTVDERLDRLPGSQAHELGPLLVDFVVG